jgi:hypothetical protein
VAPKKKKKKNPTTHGRIDAVTKTQRWEEHDPIIWSSGPTPAPPRAGIFGLLSVFLFGVGFLASV